MGDNIVEFSKYHKAKNQPVKEEQLDMTDDEIEALIEALCEAMEGQAPGRYYIANDNYRYDLLAFDDLVGFDEVLFQEANSTQGDTDEF